MPVATETIFLRLKSGKTVSETGSADANALKEVFMVTGAQKGFLRQFWGLQMENPETVIWTIDWEDVSDHHNFIKSDQYPGFMAKAAELFDFEAQKPYIVHANFTNDATAAREAPVTEFCFFMLPKGASEEQKSTLEDSFLRLVKFALEKGGATHYAIGWTLEDWQHPEAGDATCLQCLISWPTKETHMTLRETPEFKENASGIRSTALPPVSGIGSMFHVQMHGKRS